MIDIKRFVKKYLLTLEEGNGISTGILADCEKDFIFNNTMGRWEPVSCVKVSLKIF